MRHSLHEESLAALDLALAAHGSERLVLLEHTLHLHRMAIEADRATSPANSNEPEATDRQA
jgi:hypothetical protein